MSNETSTILYQVQHGSHLYGLATPESDYDLFTVVADNPTGNPKYAKQTIDHETGLDSLTTDLSTFMSYAARGVPQYVEAMFATGDVVKIDHIKDLRNNFTPNPFQLIDTYQRTIKNFYEATKVSGKLADNEYKRLRHTYRLVMNLIWFINHGRFNPTLNEEQKEILEEMIQDNTHPDKYLELVYQEQNKILDHTIVKVIPRKT